MGHNSWKSISWKVYAKTDHLFKRHTLTLIPDNYIFEMKPLVDTTKTDECIGRNKLFKNWSITSATCSLLNEINLSGLSPVWNFLLVAVDIEVDVISHIAIQIIGYRAILPSMIYYYSLHRILKFVSWETWRLHHSSGANEPVCPFCHRH